MKYLVTIVGYARTGTNYLCELLGNTFSEVNSNFELFNLKECFMNEKYINKILEKYDNNFTIKGNNSAREDPIFFLENLIKISEEPIISHKIFPEHLDINNVYKIIDKSDFVIINKRNFLDVYISHKRAIEMVKTISNPWINIDTTNYKVKFDKDEYEEKEKKYNNWYKSIEKYTIDNYKKYIFLDYDTFHNLELFNKQKLLRDNLSIFCKEFLFNINKNVKTLIKQDKSDDYSTKILNYDEFKSYYYK